MNCITEPIGQRADGRTIHRCKVCKREQAFRNADPSRVRMQCGRKLPTGPGTELRKLFAVLRVKPKKGCGCVAMAREMDALGVDGCRAKRDELAERLRSKSDKWGWTEKAAAALRAAKSGLAFQLENWSDPFPSLVDLACDRAERQGQPHDLDPPEQANERAGAPGAH